MGWVLLSFRVPRFAGVWCKSRIFSCLPIRKVLVLPFAGGVSPPLPVVSLLFSVSYPQPSRSYYLFFNYLFFNYLYGGSLSPIDRLGRGFTFTDRSAWWGGSLSPWKTAPNHCGLWKTSWCGSFQGDTEKPQGRLSAAWTPYIYLPPPLRGRPLEETFEPVKGGLRATS